MRLPPKNSPSKQVCVEVVTLNEQEAILKMVEPLVKPWLSEMFAVLGEIVDSL